MASAKGKKDAPQSTEGGFCWFSRELAAIVVIGLIGFALMVPGFMLRLEDVRRNWTQSEACHQDTY